jgi:hypothetical protein
MSHSEYEWEYRCTFFSLTPGSSGICRAPPFLVSKRKFSSNNVSWKPGTIRSQSTTPECKNSWAKTYIAPVRRDKLFQRFRSANPRSESLNERSLNQSDCLFGQIAGVSSSCLADRYKIFQLALCNTAPAVIGLLRSP